jgi:RNA polymerase sigma-70 factor, ECF subfamily
VVRRLDPKSLGQHLDALYRAAWALCGSREDAEDLVQETFTRVLARPRMIRGDERGYLMRALRNTFYSRLRTASRRPQTGPTLDDVRMALVAVDILGLSYGEAAKALDTREATITTRLYRARQRIARQLSDEPPSPKTDAREGSGPERSLA